MDNVTKHKPVKCNVCEIYTHSIFMDDLNIVRISNMHLTKKSNMLMQMRRRASLHFNANETFSNANSSLTVVLLPIVA